MLQVFVTAAAGTDRPRFAGEFDASPTDVLIEEELLEGALDGDAGLRLFELLHREFNGDPRAADFELIWGDRVHSRCRLIQDHPPVLTFSFARSVVEDAPAASD
jgi:hypothetical protein